MYVITTCLRYSGSVTWKTWLYSDDALKYIISVLQVYELQF